MFQLQSLAFGNQNAKSKQKSSSSSAKNASVTEKQWEEWKQKDSEVCLKNEIFCYLLMTYRTF